MDPANPPTQKDSRPAGARRAGKKRPIKQRKGSVPFNLAPQRQQQRDTTLMIGQTFWQITWKASSSLIRVIIRERHVTITDEVHHQLRGPPLPAPPFVSPSSVKRAIASLKPRKAPGINGVTNGALRHLPIGAIAALTRLFNTILHLDYVPQAWKEDMVMMIPKQGKDPRRFSGYQPIPLLSAVSKLFEKLLLSLILAHLQPRPDQFGFRPSHSTILHLARVVHFASAALKRKENAAAVFLGENKAFDRV